MKDIKEMSDQEKTVMLAKLVGWQVESFPVSIMLGAGEFAVNLSAPNFLYNERWMFIAWRVLNWALTVSPFAMRVSPSFYKPEGYLHGMTLCGLMTIAPADAQRAWLDKILELAIEAGLVKDEIVIKA